MTDRVKGFVVTFDEDMREEDAEILRHAILCMRNVIDVSPKMVEAGDYMNRMQIRHDMLMKLYKTFD